ncbi:hemerythrin domain-containing protein [Brevundimonas sp. NPDC092305]|uniref:hemerythrin domain-containing protein n=1 Tax=Brevundimonas sp. NPDC092305 TaxID=3363957 RepID=UPI0037F11CE5
MTEALDDALATRTGLPEAYRFLVDELPRAQWTNLPETAAFWLQMHGSFRGHQAYMDGLVDGWRKDADLGGLHRQLIPALQSFLQHLDGHHRIESGQYFPMFKRIEPRIERGIELLDRDHDAIHEVLEALFRDGMAFHQAVMGQAPDATDRANRLGDLINRAGRPLLRHLDDEEDIVIPLIQLRRLEV